MTKTKTKKRALAGLAMAALGVGVLAGCTQAETASRNISVAADQFEVVRRIVFFNSITDTYLLTIEGNCSIEPDMAEEQLEVTCKIGPDEYKKHYLGLADNVTYFIEQLEVVDASVYHYRVIFRPEAIIPEFDLDIGEQ